MFLLIANSYYSQVLISAYLYLFGMWWQFLLNPPDVLLCDGIELAQTQFLVLLLALAGFHRVVVEPVILHGGVLGYQSNFYVWFF